MGEGMAEDMGMSVGMMMTTMIGIGTTTDTTEIIKKNAINTIRNRQDITKSTAVMITMDIPGGPVRIVIERDIMFISGIIVRSTTPIVEAMYIGQAIVGFSHQMFRPS